VAETQNKLLLLFPPFGFVVSVKWSWYKTSVNFWHKLVAAKNHSPFADFTCI